MWNSVIRLCIETSLDLFISCFIRFKQVSIVMCEQIILAIKWTQLAFKYRHINRNWTLRFGRYGLNLQFGYHFQAVLVPQTCGQISILDLWLLV
ncbi:hypothetical protein FGO68_gene8555 [Halteria grandinella]|uniref:Uncharacterized protein n=1 Tax=Halteria grandinella TaxID=5974 RepID=A0A8J8P0E9_HALGN|nr:hypothetical protein FGO68_gene8555 [Halteria grandinella]